jgi:hypothetical protein
LDTLRERALPEEEEEEEAKEEEEEVLTFSLFAVLIAANN